MEVTNQTLRLIDCEPLTAYVRCTLTEADLPAHVSDVQFTHCTFSADQTRNDFVNVVFDHCDLANIDFTGAKFGGCTFTDSRLMGANFTSATFVEVHMQGCPAQMTIFADSSLRKCGFTDCDFTDASFQAVTTRTKTIFKNCVMHQVDLIDTRLKNWDVSASDIDGLRARPEDIYGLTIAPFQAATLIGMFGVRVKN
jgi:uncharacterized protein YjbI with pentapeptide repeats